MKYFLDSEFIEDGRTIDLLSIALVADDGRTFYRQNSEAKFANAGDWVWRNVYPRLEHFDMCGQRLCRERKESYDSGLGIRTTTSCSDTCPWRTRSEIRDEVLAFCDLAKFGKPEFWGYYAAYDWVAFCQLFGAMIDLPKGYPMFCRDLIQWCEELGNPKARVAELLQDALGPFRPDAALPVQGASEHEALADALWNKQVWDFLSKQTAPSSICGPTT